ncbi:MAG TPA: hypothetical protein VFS22_02540 [Flavisolibacter sp.]|nr:hypothetical protein [Flavisolibacter sp.]
MATFIIGLFLVMALALLLVYVQYKFLKAKKMKQFLYLSEQGTKNDLRFSSQEVIGDKIIALDGRKRMLLLLEERDGRKLHHTIDLEEVESCTLKKIYSRINAGELKRKKMEEFISTIALQFDFKNKKQLPVQLNFYDRDLNYIAELKPLEAKARGWQAVLSKLLTGQEKKIA